MVSLIEATPLSLLEAHSSHASSLWKSQSNTFDPAKGERSKIGHNCDVKPERIVLVKNNTIL